MACCSNGRLLAAGGTDGTIHLWNVVDNREVISFRGDNSKVTSLAFSPDGKVLASLSLDRVLRLWELHASNETPRSTQVGGVYCGVIFSPDSSHVYGCGGRPRQVRSWESSSGKETRHYEEPSRLVTSLALAPNGRFLACGMTDGSIQLLDIRTGQIIDQLVGHKGPVCGLSFSAEGQFLASGSQDTTVIIWRIRNVPPSKDDGRQPK